MNVCRFLLHEELHISYSNTSWENDMCIRFLSASHPELTCPSILKATITAKCWEVDSQNRQLYHLVPAPLSVSHSGPQAKLYENL